MNATAEGADQQVSTGLSAWSAQGAREVLPELKSALRRAEETWGRCTFERTTANKNRFWIARAAVPALRAEIAELERFLSEAAS